MKEIVFKNFISDDNRRKTTSSTEITRKNGVLIESSRESNYKIHSFANINSRLQKNRFPEKPQLYITRKINTHRNSQKFIYKIKGKMLIKFKDHIFPVSYEHTLNVEIVNLEKKEAKNEKEQQK